MTAVSSSDDAVLMHFPYGVTVTVTRGGGTDRYGNPIAGTTHTIDGCAPAPAGSTEDVDRAQTVEWDLDLLVPYDADLQAEDTVTLPGDPAKYHVDGRPAQWRSPFTGWGAGALARLKAVTG